MKTNGILAGALKIFTNINTALAKAAGCDTVGFSLTDYAILKVAMMVSALDGEVTADELKAFEKMAKKCVGYTPEGAEAALQDGLRSAGYLSLLSKSVGEKAVVTAFVNEAMKTLPADFALGRIEAVRQALVIWVAMGMADADYSSVERKAISAFVVKLSVKILKRELSADDLLAKASPLRVVSHFSGVARMAHPAPTQAFLDEAEDLLGKLRNESTALAAQAALKDLILHG